MIAPCPRLRGQRLDARNERVAFLNQARRLLLAEFVALTLRVRSLLPQALLPPAQTAEAALQPPPGRFVDVLSAARTGRLPRGLGSVPALDADRFDLVVEIRQS